MGGGRCDSKYGGSRHRGDYGAMEELTVYAITYAECSHTADAGQNGGNHSHGAVNISRGGTWAIARVRHARHQQPQSQWGAKRMYRLTTHRNETLYCHGRWPVARPSPSLELKNNDHLLTFHKVTHLKSLNRQSL